MENAKTDFIEGRARGAGSIFKRPGSPNYFVQYYAAGKLRQESCGKDSVTVAERLLRRRLADADKGIAPVAKVKKLTYDDAKKLLIDDYSNREHKSLYVTKDGKKDVCGLKHLDAFFEGRKVLHIGGLLQDFIEKRKAEKAENGTINRNLALLRRMLHLVSHRHSEYLPPHFPMLKEAEPRQGFLTYDDFLRLRENLPAALHTLVTLCYETGVRKGEAESIRWDQIDFEANVITLEGSQTKNGKPRTIPLSGEVAALLQSRSKAESPFPATNIVKAWKKARTAAKLPSLLFHDMRRAAISNLTAAGIAAPVVMSISGHRTNETFLRYNISQVTTQKDALQKVVDARKVNA